MNTAFWRLTLDTNPEDCNLKCIMCEEHSPYSDFIPRLFQESGIKRRRMPFEWVEKLFAEAAALGAREIIPSTMGEPLLYKGFERIFGLAERHGIKINLTTNGTFPKKSVEEWAAYIVPHSSDVKISWNGASAKTAEAVMLGLDFEDSLDKLRRFVACRDAQHRATGYYCRITLQLTFMQNNMHELADIVRLAAGLGVDRVKGHHLWAHFEEIKALAFKNGQQGIAAWNGYVAEAQAAAAACPKPDGSRVLLENIWPLAEEDLSQVPESYECPFLGKELWVSATGKISPCCAPDKLRDSLGDFGHIGQHSLADVLESEAYQRLMRDYKSRPLCQQCQMRTPPKT